MFIFERILLETCSDSKHECHLIDFLSLVQIMNVVMLPITLKCLQDLQTNRQTETRDLFFCTLGFMERREHMKRAILRMDPITKLLLLTLEK